MCGKKLCVVISNGSGVMKGEIKVGQFLCDQMVDFHRPGHLLYVITEGIFIWQAIRFKTRLNIGNKKVVNTIDIID